MNARACVRMCLCMYAGGGGVGVCEGNFLLRKISRFNFVRGFPHNFQAAVRNQPTS